LGEAVGFSGLGKRVVDDQRHFSHDKTCHGSGDPVKRSGILAVLEIGAFEMLGVFSDYCFFVLEGESVTC